MHNTENRVMETADSRTIQISEKTNCELSLNNVPYSSFILQPYIIPTSNIDVILGMDFLVENKILLDFGNKIMV